MKASAEVCGREISASAFPTDQSVLYILPCIAIELTLSRVLLIWEVVQIVRQ